MQNEKKVVELNINDVLPNRFQPRIKFDENSINELAVSIKKYGVIQPIVVRKIGDKYEIIAGERRYKASVIAGKQSIPAIIYELSDNDSVEIALIENVQREDLTPIEKAISYKKILDMGYMNQEQLAEKIGKSQSTIANTLRLLGLSDEVQEALLENKISERHARSLLKLKDTDDQIMMLNRIITERLTVRKTDEEIDNMLENKDEVITIPDVPTMEQPVNAPGFMDIDKIVNNAQDIIKEEKPVANMDNLLKANSPVPPVQSNQASEEELLQPGKFFNFFGEESTTTGAPEENYNFNNFFNFDSQERELASATVNPQPTMNTVGSTSVMPTFEAPTMPEYTQPATPEPTPVMPTFEAPTMPEYTQPAAPEPTPVMPTFEAPTMPEYTQPATPEPTPVMPTFEVPSAPVYDVNTPVTPTVDMPAYNIPSSASYVQPMEEPIAPQSVVPVMKDVRGAINMVRDCANNLEFQGYTVDVEEIDLEDSYQVIFKISKK